MSLLDSWNPMRVGVLGMALLAIAWSCHALPGAQPQQSPPGQEKEATSSGSAVRPNPQPARILELKETIAFGNPALDAVLSGTKCDSRGNIFSPFPDSNPDGTIGRILIVEILPGSRDTRLFGAKPLPSEEYPGQRIEYFDVNSDGDVYALVYTYTKPDSGNTQAVAPQYFVERFKDDGTADSVVRLVYPRGSGAMQLDLRQFGVLPGGNFIVAGMKSTPSVGVEPFTAVYDSKGNFIRNLELPDDVPGDQQLKAQHASSAQRDSAISAVTLGNMISSPKGYAYLLRASHPPRLYALDSVGGVARRFELSGPDPNLDSFAIGLTGETALFVDFVHPPPGPGARPNPDTFIGVFSTLSGTFESFYRLPPSAIGVLAPACSDQHGGFLFLGSTPDNHLAVFDYGP